MKMKIQPKDWRERESSEILILILINQKYNFLEHSHKKLELLSSFGAMEIKSDAKQSSTSSGGNMESPKNFLQHETMGRN